MSIALLRDDDFEVPRRPGWVVTRRDASPLTMPSISRPSANAATTNQPDRANSRFWYAPLLEALEQVATLKPDWAGPGTKAPSPQCMVAVVFLMTALAQPTTKAPSVVPTIDGRLQLVWYDAGIELEIVTDQDGDARASIFELTTGVEEDDLPVTDPRVAEAIRRLSATP